MDMTPCTRTARPRRTWRTITASLLLAGAGAGLPPAPVQAQGGADRPILQAVMNGCRADRERLCSGVVPGGGRIIACLMHKRDALMPECRNALDGAREAIGARTGTAPR